MFQFKNFCDVHCHPGSLDSGAGPESFLERELELESGSITVTDHGTLAEAHTIYTLAKKNNITPIIGVEGYFRDDDCQILKNQGIPKDENGTYANFLKYQHFCLHCKNYKAYEFLCKKLSWASLNRAEKHGSELKPLFNWQDLEELSHYDVTISNGCLIGLSSRPFIFKDSPEIGEAYFKKLSEMFGKKLICEIFPFEASKHWVDGVFVSLSDGRTLKFYTGKQLITDQGEFTASELSKAFNKKHNKITKLLGIKNRSKIEETDVEIFGVKEVADFIENECTIQSPNSDYHVASNKFTMYLAEKYGHKLFLSSDAHLSNKNQKLIQDIKLTNQSGHSWKFADALTRMSSDEAWLYCLTKLNINQYKFQAMIENSHQWADGFKNFEFKNKPSLPASFYPKDTVGHLKKLVDDYGRMKWDDPTYRTRLASEIELLHENGTVDFLPYFFLSEETRRVYLENERLTGPARGSSAGLLTSYLIGVTDIDPIRYGLSKDRFLTLDRVKSGHYPDIDSDFPDRDLLVDAEGNGLLKDRFGDCFCQISTDVKLRIRSLIKDVHRGLHGSVSKDVDDLCKKLPIPPQGIKDDDFVFGYNDGDGNHVQGMIETNGTLKEYSQKYPYEWSIVSSALSSINKTKSLHASGFVIADRPISDFIPIQKIGDVTATQFTAESVEAMGGIKLDLLLLNSLKDIQICLNLINKKNKRPKSLIVNGIKVPGFRTVPFCDNIFDIWDLPQVQDVYEDIVKVRTETLFQLDTNSARSWLGKFDFKKQDGTWGIACIQDLATFVALDRPGPLNAYIQNQNMLEVYADRKKNNEHGEGVFAELLPNTNGILIYQEDLSRVYKYFTDCSNAEAEEFRSFSSKKKKEKMIKAKTGFMERAIKKVSKQEAEHVWQTMETFAEYSFNNSHSISYSVVSYATAFLKHFFPLEWWAAVLSNASKDDIQEKFIQHCGKFLIDPDINQSDAHFTIENGKIRVPLSVIDGIGPVVHAALLSGRPYKDISDFVTKIYGDPEAKRGVSKTIISNLILTGVFDSLFPENMTFLERLQSFNEVYALVRGEKKVEVISEETVNMSALRRVMLKKKILPLAKDDLTYLFAKNNPNFFQVLNKRFYKELGKYKYTLANPKMISELGQSQIVPPGGIRICAIAYVVSVRSFRFGSNKEKQAAEICFDVDGSKFNLVRWPDWGEDEIKMDLDVEGSLGVVYLNKNKPDRPFSIYSYTKLEEPV